MTTKGPPTTAEVKKAFRHALDAIDLPPEARVIALEAFKDNLGTTVPKRRTRRQEQNQAIRDIQTLGEIMPDILTKCVQVIKRNDFTNGALYREKGELGPHPKKPWQEDMTGHGPPTWGDPVGETACWDESKHDPTGKIITAMCDAMGQWVTMAELLQSQTNIDVRDRAKRTMPDCLACGDQCLDGVRSGFDGKCYKRWTRSGRPDRSQFIATVKRELIEEQPNDLSHAND